MQPESADGIAWCWEVMEELGWRIRMEEMGKVSLPIKMLFWVRNPVRHLRNALNFSPRVLVLYDGGPDRLFGRSLLSRKEVKFHPFKTK